MRRESLRMSIIFSESWLGALLWPSLLAQAPILLPTGQAAVAELQRDCGGNRIGAKKSSLPIGDIDLGAIAAGIVEQRYSQCYRRFLQRHAEGKGSCVGLIPAIGCPTNAK